MDYLKSVLESKGRRPIPEYSGFKCIKICLTLQEASELEVYGFEVNEDWWEGPHSTPHYIPLGKFPSLYTLGKSPHYIHLGKSPHYIHLGKSPHYIP